MSTKRSYEDLEPRVETQETPEACLVLVHIPDGFAREHFGAKVEHDYGRIRVYGERPLGNNTVRRFNEVHQVPATCDINRIRGKLDGGIITITMPKKVISEEVPSQRQEAATEREAPPKPPAQETEQEPDEGPQGTPQQPAATAAAVAEDQRSGEGINSNQDPKSATQDEDEADGDETETPAQPEAKEDSTPQKSASEDAGEKPTGEETEEDKFEKIREQGKAPEEPPVDDSSKFVKEINESGRTVSPAVDAESASLPKAASAAERIKEMAASASQAVTSFAKSIDEEDRQKLIYVGAAVLVVAIGVYASYKFRSSPRQ